MSHCVCVVVVSMFQGDAMGELSGIIISILHGTFPRFKCSVCVTVLDPLCRCVTFTYTLLPLSSSGGPFLCLINSSRGDRIEPCNIINLVCIDAANGEQEDIK